MKKILGIQKDHNASACLLYDDKIIYYNQEERLSGIKKDSGLPIKTLQEICKISSEIDVLVISGYDTVFNDSLSIMSILRKLGFTKSPSFEYVPYYKSHHLMHAARAFYNSTFNEALVIVRDGKGSSYNLNNGQVATETTSVFSVSYPDKFNLVYRRFFTKSPIDENLSIVWSNNFTLDTYPIPRYVNKKTIIDIRNDFDLGFMYEGTAKSLGFDDEGGKMMGLHSYGEPDELLPDVFDENFQFNMDIFRFDEMQRHRGFDTLKYPNLSSSKGQTNFAFKIQKAFETAGLKLIKEMLELTGHKNVILSGGTALNVVANSFFRKNLADDINLYCEPHCGDEGNCIGICLYYYHERYKLKEPRKPFSMYLGGNDPTYEYSLVEGEIEINNVEADLIANLLKAGHIVGLFQGKAEAGPRALGNRSLLYDPRVETGKDIVNVIKGRESFRPFAGVVLSEHAKDWFVLEKITESPYMMYAVDVRDEKLKLIPAVVHVDNTCRIQTINQEQNTHLYNILQCFYKETNVPILLNTSFNLAGDPIVETISNAINSLRQSRLEYLYLPDIKKLIYIKN
jgi:carbamoyltransferase